MLLQASHLNKCYRRSRWRTQFEAQVVALQDVSLDLPSQSSLVVVGQSGAGKSTLARCLCGAEPLDSGVVKLDGQNLSQLRGASLASVRRGIQLVFQQSATAISPRFTVLRAIAEPLRIAGIGSRKEQQDRACAMMARVHLPLTVSHQLTGELSGGQRQRLALARALICQPGVLLLDEGFAGLDSDTEARILELLAELQSAFALSYLFITHDLALPAKVGGEVAVMQAGRIVERGASSNWLRTFTHPESLRLLRTAARAAVPKPRYFERSS